MADKWLKAPLEEILSPEFLGLDKQGLQKLEFQNPAYVGAFRLGGDPREYNNAFTVQACGCCYECSFCFVPRELNDPSLGNGSLFSSSEILDSFVKAKEDYARKGIAVKVIRLSGGEIATMIPELIVDLNNEVNRRKMSGSTYLWIDTNLSTKTYLQKMEDELTALARQRNVGFVGCIKAVGNRQTGKEDFSQITNASSEFFQAQFQVLDYIVNEIGADVYVYILPITSAGSQARKRLEELFQELEMIHKNLPLRTNMLRIHQYVPTKTNLAEADKNGRPLPEYDERSSFAAWYHILRERYQHEDLMKYRCQIPLD